MNMRDLSILKKILQEIDALERNISDIKTCKEFISDDKTKRASTMTLLNIGELAHHLSDELKKRNSHIPFKSITGLRNVAAHGYFSLSFKLIWSTIKESVPTFKLEVEKLLAGGGDDE